MSYRKFSFGFLFLFLFSAVFIAQNLKYSRVLIKGEGKELIKNLAQIGILPDHDYFTKEGLITEINEDDVALLSQNKFSYELLIDDLTSYYVERNKNSLKAAATLTDCNLPNIKTPNRFRLGSMGGFFTLAEMENILDTMALLYPNLITIKQPAGGIQSIEGRNIWYVKISDNPGQDENETEILYTALHHAREPESLSQLIYYMWYLLENYATDNEIKGLIDNTEMFFMPCLNPDGYVFNQTNSPSGGGMWRKNRRVNANNSFGVDLNRNYGLNWGFDNFGSSPNSNSDTYRGASAFSEPETQAVRNFCNGRQIKAALNAHSFGNYLIYPWGYIPSLLTPDSTRFDQWGEFLTDKSTYAFGTCDQTLFYITNGSSDDWMYGEQNTKSKIFAFTPESGSAFDGFWPASNRIIDLCKFSFLQNLNLAKVAGSCFALEDKTDHFLSTQNYVKFKVNNLGLSGNTATVSIQGISNNIASTGPAKIINSLSPLQSVIDSIVIHINNTTPSAQKVKYVMLVNSGGIIHRDTITKVFGQPLTSFYDNGSNINNQFTQVGNWSLSNTDFVSPPSSIVDSPGLYPPNSSKKITMNQVADLSNATYAHLQFYTKFDIIKFYDFAQISISTDNGSTFEPLCTPHQAAPRSYDGSEPIFDFRRENWIKEEVDLKDYLGMGILLRFEMNVSSNNQKDGIYLDDILVRKLTPVINTVGLNGEIKETEVANIFPNPSNGLFELHGPLLFQKLKIYNAIGQCVYIKEKNDTQGVINLKMLPDGIYVAKNELGFTQKLIITH